MSSSAMNAWSTSNPVFTAYAFYSSILVLKLFAVTFLTIKSRFSRNVSTANTVRAKTDNEINAVVPVKFIVKCLEVFVFVPETNLL